MEKDEGMERICWNCNNFFPEKEFGTTEMGICLNDKVFEPYLEELLEKANYDCCRELIERMKFSGNRDACPDFSGAEWKEVAEIDDESELGKKLLSLAENGKLSRETFMDILVEEQIRNIDWKTLPVDSYAAQLKGTNRKKREEAISSLGALITHGNSAAFQELFDYFRRLPPPKTIEDVWFKKEILRQFWHTDSKIPLARQLIQELYETPSNNTTRQWISEIFRFLETCPLDEIRKPLEDMLKDKRFSFRLKQKMKDILHA